jgi:hypothetical protein
MKKILFVLFAGMAFCVQGQYDTIGKYPYLYHYNWPEMGIVHDSVYCRTLSQFANVDVDIYRQNGGDTSYFSNNADVAFYQHTDIPLEIIGLAMGYETGGISYPLDGSYDDIISRSHVKTTLYDFSMTELAAVHGYYSPLYIQDVQSDASAHYFEFPGLDYSGGTNVKYKYVYYRFFGKEESVTVMGDYYIGLSYDSIPNFSFSTRFIVESHPEPYNFPLSGMRLKAINGGWSDIVWSRYVPVLFAIVKWPCVAVDSVEVVVGADGCLWADWARPSLQSAWQVRLVLPDSTEVTQMVDTNHWEYCGLSPNQSYTVYLRSQCDDIDDDHSWSGWSDAFPSVYVPSHSVSIADKLNAAVTLHPNPATDEVTVSAEGVEEAVTVSVADISGVEVLHHEGVRLPLTLRTSSLAAGTYVVRVVTPQGTAVQKLTVR